MEKHIAIVGATGVVGKELIQLLLAKGIKIEKVTLFSSFSTYVETAKGRALTKTLDESSFSDISLAFFCAGEAISKEYIPYARKAGSIVVDLSSAFRLHENVPLIIPSVNKDSLFDKKTIASPNCIVSILLSVLFPLHCHFSIKRITASTYQAVSGGGKDLMDRLIQDTKSYFTEEKNTKSYAFNLFPHESSLLESNYCEEELKIIQECRKIIGSNIEMAVACIRVPVIRAHSISASIEFSDTVTAKKAAEILSSTKGVIYTEDRSMLCPSFVSGKKEVFCGRLKDDLFQKNTLHLWILGDQLLRGAALNALEIGELFW